MGSKLTQTEIIKRFKNKHKDTFDYSKVIYTGVNNDVIIICPIHGEYSTSPGRHLARKYGGCKGCQTDNSQISLEEWLIRAEKMHGTTYDYSLVKRYFYLKEDTLKIICPTHGVFQQPSRSHLVGKGCRQCGIDRRPQNNPKTTEQFIIDANKTHKDFYDYSKTVYVNAKDKLIITCPKHGNFLQTPNDHLTGFGCDLCGREQKTGCYSLTKMERDTDFANTVVRFYIIQLSYNNK